MKIYLVGGAVRDKLLGLPVKEKDWVVVGATVQDMRDRGYKQVGKEFPVFLHPKTGEEYALARMERKIDLGYKGFTFDTSPNVSLEEDLIRRDLTINAMAETDDGQLIDPYGGKADLENRILRHVSPAFAEDPVRILRLGRFLARYAHLGFTVAPETLVLMQEMVRAGEVNALVAERVWKELERALGEQNPEKFFEVLDTSGAMPILFPEVFQNSDSMHALSIATLIDSRPLIRFAAFLFSLSDKAIADICNRYRVPNAYRELTLLVIRHYETALKAKTLSAEALLKLFNALDIYRREDRFNDFLIVCDIIAQLKNIAFDKHWLKAVATTAKAFPVQTLLNEGLTGKELADAIQKGRLEVIQGWLELNR